MINFLLKKRKNRLRTILNYFKFQVGDIVSLNFKLNGFNYNFTGLCFIVRKKNMLSSNTTFCLRNVFFKIVVEFYVMLFNVCRVNLKFLDYARKRFKYRKSKLYYLRNKINSESLVKL